MKPKRTFVYSLLFCFLIGISFCFTWQVKANERAAAVSTPRSDIAGHWAETELMKWLNQELVEGYPDGTFQPNQEISRAEFFALVNRAFNYNKITALNYTDVSEKDWFVEEIGKAQAAGYLMGYPDSMLKPNQEISRQEVAAILAKILALEANKDDVQLVRDAGYMIGYPDGSFQGEKPLTRAEAITVLDRAAGMLIRQKGTYGSATEKTTLEGNVTITAGEVTLQNLVIMGDLYLTEGIGNEVITLKNVYVKGRTRVATEVNLQKDQQTLLSHITGTRPETLVGKVSTIEDPSAKRKKDRKPPAFLDGYPQISGVAPTQFNLLVQTNEPGQAYYLVLPAEAEAPNAAQVIAGQDASGNPVAANLCGTLELTAGTAASVTITELVPHTTYAVYVLAEDHLQNGQETASKVEVTTEVVAVTGVSLDKATLSLAVGGPGSTLTATVAPVAATNQNISWSSDDETVATVSAGVITPLTVGTAMITGTTEDGNFTDTCEVTVIPAVGAAWTVGTATTLDRLGSGIGKTAGDDFDSIYPWSEMKLCNVADDGTINAYLGDAGFASNGSNGQVMVKIPKFYYRHIYEEVGGENVHQFWVAAEPATGFKLHPAFMRDGVEKDYVLLGAYKASFGKAEDGLTDTLSSVTGALPALQKTIAQFRTRAQARGAGWNQVDMLTRNAVALLYLVEYADTNCQKTIGKGITLLRYSYDDEVIEANSVPGNTLTVSPDTGSNYMKGQIIDVTTHTLGQRKVCQDREIVSINNTDPTKTIITVNGDSFTTEVGYLLYHVAQRGGGCDSLAGKSGIAPLCPDESPAIDTKVSVVYRGMEDLWGNSYEFIDGIKLNNEAREPYIADHDFTNSAAYLPTGITLAPTNGYVTNFAFSEQADWLLMPATTGQVGEAGANYNTYIADYYYQNWGAETERVTIAGGGYTSSQTAGLFYWTSSNGMNLWGITQSARLLFIP